MATKEDTAAAESGGSRDRGSSSSSGGLSGISSLPSFSLCGHWEPATSGSGAKTEYVLVLRQGELQWVVSRRYSALRRLSQTIASLLSKPPRLLTQLPAFPPKKLGGKAAHGAAFIEARSLALAKWCKGVIAALKSAHTSNHPGADAACEAVVTGLSLDQNVAFRCARVVRVVPRDHADQLDGAVSCAGLPSARLRDVAGRLLRRFSDATRGDGRFGEFECRAMCQTVRIGGSASADAAVAIDSQVSAIANSVRLSWRREELTPERVVASLRQQVRTSNGGVGNEWRLDRDELAIVLSYMAVVSPFSLWTVLNGVGFGGEFARPARVSLPHPCAALTILAAAGGDGLPLLGKITAAHAEVIRRDIGRPLLQPNFVLASLEFAYSKACRTAREAGETVPSLCAWLVSAAPEAVGTSLAMKHLDRDTLCKCWIQRFKDGASATSPSDRGDLARLWCMAGAGPKPVRTRLIHDIVEGVADMLRGDLHRLFARTLHAFRQAAGAIGGRATTAPPVVMAPAGLPETESMGRSSASKVVNELTQEEAQEAKSQALKALQEAQAAQAKVVGGKGKANGAMPNVIYIGQ